MGNATAVEVLIDERGDHDLLYAYDHSADRTLIIWPVKLDAGAVKKVCAGRPDRLLYRRLKECEPWDEYHVIARDSDEQLKFMNRFNVLPPLAAQWRDWYVQGCFFGGDVDGVLDRDLLLKFEAH